MAIIAKEGGSFTPAPEGTHAAVCVDVVDLGMLDVTFGGKTKTQHKIRISWQIDEDMKDGKPFLVSKRYTLSLHEKAGLRKDLESWRGKSFTPGELDGFDVENVVSVGCMLNIVHAPNPNGGSPYANVTAVMKMPKGMGAPSIRDYVRVQDRPAEEVATSQSHEYAQGVTDDDIPF